ncbi:N(4)-(Beta-N-acetylglucosaminyl)-L-asparaginase-like [Hylaeus anthracinus]|uniref:N(4)-(Beta-N-acetylglucosaminyl)-L-asparaginase- like n=1 Tax=Hylaeus volcanicus TaxID=313075 RepID=UPI0023B83298|nr:N(4)-(Beta-N-acetylglucosaminyl)-L-asparaginase-like [Hylaeus volcanicus]XP_053989076.1 N(4)-(Beta-N-acetylglucosaminyl)-L-asparaginase-like [Hylaeus volcanicus]XP_053989077.1 N(4)-(Beta-N-acetylglucosaminyl)-L-asparaginase-like [Hylaeus volcanicus]XP_054016635.1 N(4)-(Beta-N-acetylglucosaminyl)-L-asparaginase-like [Hylaeus anthracinus]XP_054016637.1 N(4)-(Beta-N-acetylglucosaminyl)-L-asparaginase-like [Hylaeus anthracinus]XP_054016638.1 N(4)-(Beta-N-acetylglucosaminyl)-L-asparaginase-like 
MKLLLTIHFFAIYFLNYVGVLGSNNSVPLVVITWDYQDATQKAWDVLYNQKRSALDAIEESCSLCEQQRCRKTVGYGGSPDESGETTLDALIMDGVTMDVGGVGLLRNIKNAISVARKVLENTKHSLLGGELAAQFALEMGFKEESLQTEESKKMWLDWKKNNCQPNFWKNVAPDPKKSCGPYRSVNTMNNNIEEHESYVNEENHDTIGVIAIDSKGHIAAGTSTNGARNKIPGRIGDSPIAGAGAYADQKVGAAAGTGEGDIMMRFLPSFLAVEEMRRGASPTEAATTAIRRIAEHYPTFTGAVIALNKEGEYGAACNGITRFAHYIANPQLGKPTMNYVDCIDAWYNVVRAGDYQ